MSSDPRSASPAPTLSRREFMQRLTEAAAGTGLLASAFAGYALTASQRAEAAEAVGDRLGKLPKRDMGPRMGHIKVAPVAISSDWNRALYGPGLAAGINFIHKAGYWSDIPDELKGVPRESYYTDITVDSTPNNPDDEDRAYRQVTDSLSRNGLKYYDIFRAHFGWKTVDAMRNQTGTYRAFQRLKREGKVRHFGVSQHDYRPYPEMIAAQIQDGLIDSIQLFFTYGESKEVQEIVDKAHQAGIAMNAMKIFQNGHGRMSADSEKMAQMKAPAMIGRACIRHVMTLPSAAHAKPIFSYCVTNLRNFQQFEENVGALAHGAAAADGFHVA